jgi:hypothetical protein
VFGTHYQMYGESGDAFAGGEFIAYEPTRAGLLGGHGDRRRHRDDHESRRPGGGWMRRIQR